MRRVDQSLALRKTFTRRHFQLAATLYVKNTLKGAVWYNSTIVYNWARGKFYSQFIMPDNMQSYSRDERGCRVDVIYDSEREYFCLYAEHPDATVPGRMWIIETEIAVIDNKAKIAVRQSYTTSVDNDSNEPEFTIPKFVREIADKGIIDVRRLEERPRKIGSREKVEEVLELITDPNRNMPVILVSERKDESAYSSYMSGYFVDSLRLAKKIGLIAHVYEIDHESAEYLCETTGRRWGVYNGAVRTYYTDVDFSLQ